MNSTKEWMILERIETAGVLVDTFGFAEISTLVYEIDGSFYSINYWDGQFDGLTKIKEKLSIKRYKKRYKDNIEETECSKN